MRSSPRDIWSFDWLLQECQHQHGDLYSAGGFSHDVRQNRDVALDTVKQVGRNLACRYETEMTAADAWQ